MSSGGASHFFVGSSGCSGPRMRMHGTVLPPICVLLGNNSIFLPGQSLVSSPHASATLSQFVKFNGRAFCAPLKYRTVFLCSVPSWPFNVSSGARSMVRVIGLPFRSSARRYLEGKTSGFFHFRSFRFAGSFAGKAPAAIRRLDEFCLVSRCSRTSNSSRNSSAICACKRPRRRSGARQMDSNGGATTAARSMPVMLAAGDAMAATSLSENSSRNSLCDPSIVRFPNR